MVNYYKLITWLLIALAAWLFGWWCGTVHGSQPQVSHYLLRNWLQIVPITICIAEDPNDPNQITTIHTHALLNYQTWISNRSPWIDAITQGRPYGIGWSDDRKWRGNAVEVIE